VTGEQRNIAVVRRFIDGAINGRDLAVADETWADDMTWHDGSLGTYKTVHDGCPASVVQRASHPIQPEPCNARGKRGTEPRGRSRGVEW
jgi:hypothetical protein